MGGSTRENLIQVAADLFYERGFQAVGLDQVLERVGITKTAFYKHFESKDDLIIAVLHTRDGEDIAELIEYMRTRASGDPKASILAMFDFLGDWFKDPGFRGCLFMNAATEFPVPHDPVHKAAAAHGDHMAATLRALTVQMGAADPDGVTRQLMLLVAGAIASRHVGGVLDAAESARHVAAALLASVRMRAA